MYMVQLLTKYQAFLIPASAFVGIGVGIYFSSLKFAKKQPTLSFWTSFLVIFLIINLAYFAGGGVLARLSYFFTMGFFSFNIKLLR
ncbi:MAG: hypothetical protein JNN15_02670 [Blastocatellia bacterium]|nr:hypothetical protein [Blastocatellia bacterium]